MHFMFDDDQVGLIELYNMNIFLTIKNLQDGENLFQNRSWNTFSQQKGSGTEMRNWKPHKPEKTFASIICFF